MKRMSKGETKRTFIRREIGVISEHCVNAIDKGMSPIDFLAEKGIEDPVQEWYSLRRWMKSCRSELYARIPLKYRIELPGQNKQEDTMKKPMISETERAEAEPVTKRGPGRPRKTPEEPVKEKTQEQPKAEPKAKEDPKPEEAEKKTIQEQQEKKPEGPEQPENDEELIDSYLKPVVLEGMIATYERKGDRIIIKFKSGNAVVEITPRCLVYFAREAQMAMNRFEMA